MTRIYGWHFLRNNGTTRGATSPESGGLEVWDKELIMDAQGLHMSRQPIDALDHAESGIVRRVYAYGDIVEGDNKLVASHRKEVWRIDATQTLHWFVVWCARRALQLDLWDDDGPDPRSIAAINTKDKWLRCKATNEELAVARIAAWEATGNPTRDAARARARDVSWAAATAASRAASWATARDVSRTTAWATAGDAFSDTSWAAARAAQNDKLTAMLKAQHREERGSNANPV
jgi:hypothetical protein